MDEKNRVGAPDFAAVMFISIATFFSAYGILPLFGLLFFGFDAGSELLDVFCIFPFLLWLVALACFKFPVSGTALYWLALCLAALGLMSGTHTGDVWADANLVLGRLVFHIFGGVVLAISMFMRIRPV